MVSRFSELCVDANDPIRLARFWHEVLGWPFEDVDPDESDTAVALRGPEGAPLLLFIEVPEPKTVKDRLHIDVTPVDRDQAAEVERVLALGATHADVGQGDDVSWVVLADPEGNEFCILRGEG